MSRLGELNDMLPAVRGLPDEQHIDRARAQIAAALLMLREPGSRATVMAETLLTGALEQLAGEEPD